MCIVVDCVQMITFSFLSGLIRGKCAFILSVLMVIANDVSSSNPEFLRWNPSPSKDCTGFALWIWATTSWLLFILRPLPSWTSLCGSSTWAEPSTTTLQWPAWARLSTGAPWRPWEHWTCRTTVSSFCPRAFSPTWAACGCSGLPTTPWWPSTTPPFRV